MLFDAHTDCANKSLRLFSTQQKAELTPIKSHDEVLTLHQTSRVLVTSALCIALLSVAPAKIEAATIYVGLGGQNGVSTNNGAIGTLNPATGAITVIGTPAGVPAISGLTFTSNGNLWGSTQNDDGILPPPGPNTTSDLIQINPQTGALISSDLIETATGTPVSIADLATQPGTDTIFGIQSPNDANFNGQANLYTISTTGTATLVGGTGVFFGAIAFAPNGTLYMTSADLIGPATTTFPCPSTDPDQTNCALSTLNPATGATIISVGTSDFYSALGISGTGVIWAGNGAGDLGPGTGQFFAGVSTLNATTGIATFIGNTGTDFVGDIAFQPVPEPSSLVLFGIGLALLAARRLRKIENRGKTSKLQH
jgi:hypothetical protein